jgi:hypothetical protein
MKMNKLKYLILSSVCISTFVGGNVAAQDVIEIQPLFEYPTAPEELNSLADKSDYLVEHFWDSMNFRNKTTVDQTALNHAFRVYTAPLRWANRDKALVSVNKLIESIQKNPALFIQFTKAAEENMYGPRAEVWVDEVYVQFLKAFVKNKKVQEERKNKYRKQLQQLESCLVGAKAPGFEFENIKGTTSSYFPMSTVTMLIFGNPKDTDWRLARLRMETNVSLSQAVDKGKVNILYILPEKIENWQSEVSNYPSDWTIGCSEGVKDIYDMRVDPSIYVVGSDGNIFMKNVPLETAVNSVVDLVK